MQFNRTKDFQTPSDEESVKSVDGSPWRDTPRGGLLIIVQDKIRKRLGKRVNFDKNRSVWGGNVDYGRYPAVSLRIGRIGRRPHLGHLGCLFGLSVEFARVLSRISRQGV